MIWNSAAEFFAMGGYAGYVWGSLSITALLMTVESILLRRRRSSALSGLKRECAASKVAAAYRLTGNSPDS